MSKGSCFLVFFLGDFSLDDAENALQKASMKVTRDGEELIAQFDEGPMFRIGVTADEWVATEAQEISEEFAIPALAGSKKRYEVHFDDLEEALFEYNSLFEVEMTLKDLTRGWILLSWNGELLKPED